MLRISGRQTGGQPGQSHIPDEPSKTITGRKRTDIETDEKTDHIPEKEYDLSGILTGKRFDWSAANLDDISIALDYSGNIISVSIIDWQTGMESEIVI